MDRTGLLGLAQLSAQVSARKADDDDEHHHRQLRDARRAAHGRTTLDFFRIEDGLVAEHWESVDWVRAYQAFGLLSDEVNDE